MHSGYFHDGRIPSSAELGQRKRKRLVILMAVTVLFPLGLLLV